MCLIWPNWKQSPGSRNAGLGSSTNREFFIWWVDGLIQAESNYFVPKSCFFLFHLHTRSICYIFNIPEMFIKISLVSERYWKKPAHQPGPAFQGPGRFQFCEYTCWITVSGNVCHSRCALPICTQTHLFCHTSGVGRHWWKGWKNSKCLQDPPSERHGAATNGGMCWIFLFKNTKMSPLCG